MSYQDVDDFLNAAGAPAVSWKDAEPGTIVKGKVVSSEVTQQTDPDGNPKKWEDTGTPMKQLVVTIHNPEWVGERYGDKLQFTNTDGTKRLFCKGSRKPESKSLLAAVIDALRKADAKLEPGGELTVKYLGKGVPTRKGYAAPNLFDAKYDKPAFDPAAEEEW